MAESRAESRVKLLPFLFLPQLRLPQSSFRCKCLDSFISGFDQRVRSQRRGNEVHESSCVPFRGALWDQMAGNICWTRGFEEDMCVSVHCLNGIGSMFGASDECPPPNG
jgi:hypothetical protein